MAAVQQVPHLRHIHARFEHTGASGWHQEDGSSQSRQQAAGQEHPPPIMGRTCSVPADVARNRSPYRLGLQAAVWGATGHDSSSRHMSHSCVARLTSSC